MWRYGQPAVPTTDGGCAVEVHPCSAVIYCAACSAHPQLAAQPEWTASITNMKWFKIAKHPNCGTHAVSLALWSSGGRVRHVTHTLPMEQQEALRAHFRPMYRVVKHFGMLLDVEAASLNGVNLIEAYRCHRVVRFCSTLPWMCALGMPN